MMAGAVFLFPFFTDLEVLILAARPVILHIATAPSIMSVNISWNSTNNHTGIKILDYRIILIDTITQEQRQFIRIRVKHLYVTRLKHNRTYVVKVQAENEDGYGRFMIRRFRTLEAGQCVDFVSGNIRTLGKPRLTVSLGTRLCFVIYIDFSCNNRSKTS